MFVLIYKSQWTPSNMICYLHFAFISMATRFKSRMLIRLLSGFTQWVRVNLAKICLILTATGQPSNVTQRLVIITGFYEPFHIYRHFSTLTRHKNTAGRRESGKNVVHSVFVFMQIIYIIDILNL